MENKITIYPQSEMEKFCAGCPCFKMDNGAYSEKTTCNHDSLCKRLVGHIVGVIMLTEKR
jgi:hypothetical protein